MELIVSEMLVTDLASGISSYSLIRKAMEIVLDDGFKYPSVKGWPFSSWAISILHDLVVIPSVSCVGNVDLVYVTACSYYMADFIWFARTRSFQGLLYHHLSTILVILVALMYLDRPTRKRYGLNILYLTVGSGILNVRGVLKVISTRSPPDSVYGMLYLVSRMMVIKSLRNATRLELAISAPLLIHNMRIVYRLLVRQR